jgi:hypothetical protein
MAAIRPIELARQRAQLTSPMSLEFRLAVFVPHAIG